MSKPKPITNEDTFLIKELKKFTTDKEHIIFEEINTIIDDLKYIENDPLYSKDDKINFFKDFGYTIDEFVRSFEQKDVRKNRVSLKLLCESKCIFKEKTISCAGVEKRDVYSLGFSLLYVLSLNKNEYNKFIINFIRQHKDRIKL